MVTTIIAGLSLGAVYAIVAIAYNIVFVSTKVFNFAQAQFLLIGAFAGVTLGNMYALPLGVTVVLCALLGAAVGALEEVFAIRRLSGRGSHSELVTTLGVGTMLSGVALILYGSDPRRTIYFADQTPIEVFGARTSPTDLALIAVALLLSLVVGLVTRRTMLGLSSLATSEDRQAAQLRGVNVTWLALSSFAIAGGLLAALGPLVAAKTYATYALGDVLAVKSFVALAIGGFGSYTGALIGGFGVGLLELFGARYLGSEWQNIGVFVLLLVVLLVLPQGITGTSKQRTV